MTCTFNYNNNNHEYDIAVMFVRTVLMTSNPLTWDYYIREIKFFYVYAIILLVNKQ